MKRVGLFLHGTKAEAAAGARRLVEALVPHGIEAHALAADAARIGAPGVIGHDAAFPRDLDLVFVLGGDGTLLRAAGTPELRSAPLLAVNFGHLGFLSTLEQHALEGNLDSILDGAVTVEERSLLAWSNGDDRGFALNEVIVARNEVGRAIRFSIEISGEPLATLTADGVIVATATGSTAYSFSAGGPLVSPRLECMIVTPISPHGAFNRAMVVPPDEDVVLRLHRGDDAASMSADGGPAKPLQGGSVVTLGLGPERVKLAKLAPSPFWRLLREKFELPDGQP